MATKTSLGKGLSALLPGAGTNQVPTPPPLPENRVLSKDRIPAVSFAKIDEIKENFYQPRQDFHDDTISELAESIKANGIIQPLIVRKSQSGYELIAGERRLRAAKSLGLAQVPIVIRSSTDREALELALIENIQRENLNAVEEGLAYKQLIDDFSLTQEELAKRLGKERASVANHLRILRLPQFVLNAIRHGQISFGHAKILAGIESREKQEKVAKKIIEQGLSVRALEDLLKTREVVKASESEQTPETERLINLTKELSQFWSTKVELKGSSKRGKIIIHFSSKDELDRLVEAMHN